MNARDRTLRRLRPWRIFSLPRTLHRLGAVGDEAVVERVLPYLEHRRAQVREAACEALAVLKPLHPSRAVEGICRLMSDRSPRVRATALWTLGQLYMAMNPGMPPAPELTKKPANVSYRLFWTRARDKAMRAMEQGLNDPDPEVRNISRVFCWVLESTDSYPLFEGGD